MILKLIDWIGEYIGWGKLLLGLFIVGLFVTIGIYKAELSHTKKELAENKANYVALENSYDNYKKLIADAEELKNQRIKTAEEALKQVQIASSNNKKLAVNLAALNKPSGVSDCSAVEELLNANL